MESTPLSLEAQNQVFLEARTHSHWQDRPVPVEILEKIYNLAKMGPTSANCCPLRVLFVQSKEAKDKLKQALMPANIDKTMQAPVTAIFSYDLEFYEKLPVLFPHVDAKPWFTGSADLIEKTAVLNGSLQAAYFIIAARMFGLDCGPMGGFDKQLVDQLFFQGTSWRSNFLCNLGYGISEKLHPRLPRLDFAEVCTVV